MARGNGGGLSPSGTTSLGAEDELRVREWIRQNMVHGAMTDHFHTSRGLRIMVDEDTGVAVSEADFRALVVHEGFHPVNPLAREWEFKISKVPFRRRSEASVGGWLPSHAKYRATRLG